MFINYSTAVTQFDATIMSVIAVSVQVSLEMTGKITELWMSTVVRLQVTPQREHKTLTMFLPAGILGYLNRLIKNTHDGLNCRVQKSENVHFTDSSKQLLTS